MGFWYQLSFVGWRALNNFITLGIINPVVKLTVVLVTCRLCVCMCIYIYVLYSCISGVWNIFICPQQIIVVRLRIPLASGKVLNFPNDFLQGSFLLGRAVIRVIVFRCKIPSWCVCWVSSEDYSMWYDGMYVIQASLFSCVMWLSLWHNIQNLV